MSHYLKAAASAADPYSSLARDRNILENIRTYMNIQKNNKTHLNIHKQCIIYMWQMHETRWKYIELYGNT